MVLGSNGKGNGKTWIHTPESLINGKVTYTVKFIGKAEVPEPRGMSMVKMALKKLDFSRQLKRTEGMKPAKVELGISIHSVSISEIKTKELLHNISLHRVSFCADDKEDKRLFAFIAKLEDGKHYCYGLDSLHQANDITLTIGQAFELAYDKFLKQNPSATQPKKVTDMSKRIQELEFENSELRRRIAQLEAVNKPETSSNTAAVIPQVEPKPTQRTSANAHSTSNIAVSRRSNQFVTSGTSRGQETIGSKADTVKYGELLETSFPSYSPALLSNTTTDLEHTFSHAAQNGLTTSPSRPSVAGTTYASVNVNHGNKCSTLPPTFGLSPERYGMAESDGVPENQCAKKFHENIQQTARRNQRNNNKAKKCKGSLFPAKILTKKLKQIVKESKHSKEHQSFDETSASSCSTPSSSAYADLDDIITTLQKMMSKAKPKQNGNLGSQAGFPANIIGQKLATCHDPNQPNYDIIKASPSSQLARHEAPPLPPRTIPTSNMEGNISPDSHSSTVRQSRTDLCNSNDDISSLSTTSHDSSSTEHIYNLQALTSTASYDIPRSIFRDGSSNAPSMAGSITPANQWPSFINTQGIHSGFQKPSLTSHPVTNTTLTDQASMSYDDSVMDTLRQLSGEEGYMVLSGQDRAALLRRYPSYDGHHEEPCVDNTYDSVNRLMEAVREAAGKDHAQSILAAPAGGHGRRSDKRPSVVKKEFNPPPSQVLKFLTSNQHRTPSSLSTMHSDHVSVTSTDSLGSSVLGINPQLGIPTHLRTRQLEGGIGNSLHGTRALPQHINTSIPIVSSMNPFSADQSFVLRNTPGGLSRETDIIFTEQSLEPPTLRRLTRRKDAFNMQPFVPTSSAARLPQPPSRKSTKQENLWSEDIFDPFRDQHVSGELQEMQKQTPALQHQSAFLASQLSARLCPSSKKSNYHIVSHPLIRKNKSPKQTASALKWSKKYFPGGKKKAKKQGGTKSTVKLDEEVLRSLGKNFSRGLDVSGEITLDSFDPLKQ